MYDIKRTESILFIPFPNKPFFLRKKALQRHRKHFGLGEIARYEQFLLFPQCFQKTCTADTQKPGLVLERVKPTFVRAWLI